MFSRIRTTRNKREIIEVGWTPVPKPPEITLTMDKPDHLYTSIYSDIDSAFKLCPAFTAFFKNYYIVRSPIDIKFVIKKITDYDAIITIEDKKIEEYVTFDDRKTEWSHDYRNPFDPKLKSRIVTGLDTELLGVAASDVLKDPFFNNQAKKWSNNPGTQVEAKKELEDSIAFGKKL